MTKDPERTEAKKAEIAAAALELFFEHGYDGTSVRMIQRKVGKEAGLFYYYFASKDAVFEAAIDLFFVAYEKPMRDIVERGNDITPVISEDKSWNEGMLDLPAFHVGNWYWKQYGESGLFDLDKKYRDYSQREKNLLL